MTNRYAWQRESKTIWDNLRHCAVLSLTAAEDITDLEWYVDQFLRLLNKDSLCDDCDIDCAAKDAEKDPAITVVVVRCRYKTAMR